MTQRHDKTVIMAVTEPKMKIDEENDCDRPNENATQQLIKVRTDLFPNPLKPFQENFLREQVVPMNQEKHIPIFKCELCEQTFSSKLGRYQHFGNKHSKCEECGKTCLWTLKLLQRHQLRDCSKYRCNTCNTSFLGPETLEEHRVAKHSKRPKHTTLPQPHKHIRESTAGKQSSSPIKCELCDLQYQTMEEKELHIKEDHFFKCDLCGESFESRSKMETHRYQESLVKKAKETKIIKCEFCEEKCTSQIILKSHVQLFHNTKKHKIVEEVSTKAQTDVIVKNVSPKPKRVKLEPSKVTPDLKSVKLEPTNVTPLFSVKSKTKSLNYFREKYNSLKKRSK